jgi:RNA polymerase sigma-B factor
MEIGTARSARAETVRQRWAEREQWTKARFRERGGLSGRPRRRVEDEIVLEHLDLVDGLVRRLAPRYRDLGDLRQVGCVGLINAVHRFDPVRGDAFVPYAVPTISGEVKRYLRDQGWFVRPPRSVQELRAATVRAMPDLAQQLRHEPTVGELAAYLHTSRRAVQEAIATPTSLHPISLDDRDDDSSSDAMLGSVDVGLEGADTRVLVRRAIATLPPRDRRIVYLRFFEERTQREIAADIGVTQMQVSRLLTSILVRLRAGVTADPDAAGDAGDAEERDAG